MVTAPKSGAEVIPFVKTYCNLPAAIVSCEIYLARVVVDVGISDVIEPLLTCRALLLFMPTCAIEWSTKTYSTLVLSPF